MTLHDWCQLTDQKPTHPTTECGAVSVICSPGNPHRPLLWGLADFRVDSYSHGVVWLLPRRWPGKH
jgi:hypothetical protein